MFSKKPYDGIAALAHFRDAVALGMAEGLSALFSQEVHRFRNFHVGVVRGLQESDRQFTGIGFDRVVPKDTGPTVFAVLNRARRHTPYHPEWSRHGDPVAKDVGQITDSDTKVIEVQDGGAGRIDSVLFVSRDGVRVWVADRSLPFASALTQSHVLCAPVVGRDGTIPDVIEAQAWRLGHVRGLYKSHFREIDRMSWHAAERARGREQIEIMARVQKIKKTAGRIVADVTVRASNETPDAQQVAGRASGGSARVILDLKARTTSI